MEAGTFVPIHLAWSDVATRFTAAFLLSFALGMERFIHKRPIDFRPFIIISLASCALMVGIMELPFRVDDKQISIDPAKEVSGIMAGIGFLGAGALFHEKKNVQGTGSASAIWGAGVIGIVCGLGLIWLGLLLALSVTSILALSRPFTEEYAAKSKRDDDRGDNDHPDSKTAP